MYHCRGVVESPLPEPPSDDTPPNPVWVDLATKNDNAVAVRSLLEKQAFGVSDEWKASCSETVWTVWTPLSRALEHKADKVVAVLLAAGASPNDVCYEFTGGYKLTPLGYALSTKCPRTALMLVEAGAQREGKFVYNYETHTARTFAKARGFTQSWVLWLGDETTPAPNLDEPCIVETATGGDAAVAKQFILDF
jgi:hypothetical protein